MREVLRDFYSEMNQDAMIGFFFRGKDTDAIAEKQSEFILKAAGLVTIYTGKNPASAHLGMPPIRMGQFNRRIQILKDLLSKKGLPQDAIDTWIAFEESFRNVVVTRTVQILPP